MKVSVVTVVLNGEKTLRDCIESVRAQEGVEVEHILIDGQSTDGTLAIINEHRDRFTHVVSEPDNGIHDAMNKGIALASGDVVALLNADDIYAHTHSLEVVARAFTENSEVECVYGDIDMVNNNGVVRRAWRSRPHTDGLFRTGWHPPHSAFYVKADAYKKYGVFDTSLGIAADYELMLRFLEKHHAVSVYIPQVLVHMRMGGASNGSFKGIWNANRDCVRAWKHNGMHAPRLLFFRKPLSKLIQFVPIKA